MKFLVLLLLALSACARPDYIDPKLNESAQSNPDEECALQLSLANLCAKLEWTLGPQSPAESEFILKFWNKSDTVSGGTLVDPEDTLSAILWMPSMGHGSSPVTIEKIETGVYRVRRVYFIMPGDWEVRIYLKNGSTVIDQATVSLLL
ncbi:FixH family protein [Bdellovibrio sp. HCB288]|uniref:FixH family protein n=1 Tax=Bdellovibrio sp. HCB288 TaxID=3394355 RepID=UPI0039B4D8C6